MAEIFKRKKYKPYHDKKIKDWTDQDYEDYLEDSDDVGLPPEVRDPMDMSKLQQRKNKKFMV